MATTTAVSNPPPPVVPTPAAETSLIPKKLVRARPLFDPEILRRALKDSVVKLNPVTLMKNPVIFVVEVGAVLVLLFLVRDIASGARGIGFELQIDVWLWFTVLFATFAEAMAEARGKAQAESLRKTRTDTIANRLAESGRIEKVSSSKLRAGDVVACSAGEVIPGDGEVIDGIATVDESVITGESAPVIRESGGDRSAVTGGTRVLSDQIRIKITSNPGETFLDRMIALVEGAERQKTPNEIALNIMIAGLTIIFLLAVVSLVPYAIYSVNAAGAGTPPTIATYVSLLVCLIPTTIGGLLSAIGIAGMDRVMQHNVLAMSGKAVEAAGDVNTLLLDKTGTITLGSRQAVAFLPASGVTEGQIADAAQLSSLADETPEGRSIVVLAKEKYGLRGRDVAAHHAQFIPFSAYTKMSGVDIEGRQLRKGATDAIVSFVKEQGGKIPSEVTELSDKISRTGGTPLAVADGAVLLGIIHLKDIVKVGMKERIAQLRAMGIRSVMVTGDNPLTAAAIASEAGVDDFIAQADVGLAMNTGTTAAREAGNMVDLDSNPTKLIEVVAIGKQLLITRGALTTFSIMNDVAKYFAIIPAMFMATYPALNKLNIMYLRTPESAVLAAVIFNALIIVALVPLSLRGVRYRPQSAAQMLRRNLLIYGIGGLVAPFPGIWAIDRMLGWLHLA